MLPQSVEYRTEYENGWKVNDIFIGSSIGIITARDGLTIHWTADEVRETVSDFVSLPIEEARERYNLGRDSRDWQVHLAQSDLRNHADADQHITPIHYRPFDTRWTYYTGQSRGFHCSPRPTNMPHLLHDNLALCTHRRLRSANTWQHAFIGYNIVDGNCLSLKDGPTQVFPLYLYSDSEVLLGSTEPELNFKPAFLTALAEKLELPQISPLNLPEDITPEEILAYIYAVLYSPTYRERYYEFLKYDFPRIPLPQDIDNFRKLAALGQELINWHLLKDVQIPNRHRFEGEGDGVVGKPRHKDDNVWINNTQHFTNVPAAVWEFEVGAYQVCEKWLKDRRGEMLSHAEVRQYRSILVAIAETLRVMAEIDEVLEF